MKKQKNEKKDKLLFDNFVKGANHISPDLSPDLENRIMKQILKNSTEMKPSRFLKFQMPPMRVLTSVAALLIILLVAVIFLAQPGQLQKPTDLFRTVAFRFKGKDASKVCLVGDFNSWQKNSDCLLRKNGYWMIKKQLKVGRFYKYAFLVNNKKVVKDIKASQYVDDGFGGTTSVVYVN